MSKMNAKKLAKKKEREKRVKKEVLERRTALRAKAKEEREKEKERREAQKIANRVNGVTIRYDRDPEAVVNQLAHNYEILKALEDEQKLMKEQRDNSNQINTEGIPPELIVNPDAAKKKTSFKASADVVFTPNPEPAKEEKKDVE